MRMLLAVNLILLTAMAVLLSFAYDVHNPEALASRESLSYHAFTSQGGIGAVESRTLLLMQVNDTLQASVLLGGCTAARVLVNFTVEHVLTGRTYGARYVVREAAWDTPVFTASRSGVYGSRLDVRFEGVSGQLCSVTIRYFISQPPKEGYLKGYAALVAMLALALAGANLYAALRR